jgi:uncharacterized protein (DUF1800 family)
MLRLPHRSGVCFSFALAVLTAVASSVAPAQTGTGTGLKADYYANPELKAPVALSRTDSVINFNYAQLAPAGTPLPVDKFSVRWTGKVEAPVTGAYTFFTRSDDGVRLWVNGKLVITNWTNHGAAWDQTLPITLTAGQRYDIQLDYYENTGNAVLELHWSYPGQVRQLIPATRLYPTAIPVIPPPAPVSRVWLSDINWLTATNGWGPVELDKSNGENLPGDGRTMSLNGLRYSDGLGVHPNSTITYMLADRYDIFKATIGIDDEVEDKGSAVFEVWLDGVMKYRSPKLTGAMPGLAIEVPVENVREMKLVVTDGGDGMAYDHANWAQARLEGVESVKYLSSMGWQTATNGLGPVERDRANGTAAEKDGPTMKIRGITHSRGLGTYANSEIVFDLDRKFERFSSTIGIDDSSNNTGSVIFEVWGDGVRLYQSPVLRGFSPPTPVSIMIGSVDLLKLKVVDAGDGNAGDIADWAMAQLLPKGTDSAVPLAPAGVTAVPGNGSVTLSWAAAANAVTYRVFRSTTAGTDGSVVAGEVLGTTWTNGGLTNGTPYFYRVRAENGAGVGPLSAQVSATPTLPPPPGVPTNLTATPQVSKITLTFTGVAGASSYRIFVGTASNAQSPTPIATISGTTYLHGSLNNGTRYFYKVAAVGTGGQGPMSAEASATPQALPAAPAGLTLTSGNARITLNWGAVNTASSYRVYRGTTPGGQGTLPLVANLTVPTFIDTAVTNGTTYYYRVTAVNESGEGPRSSEVNGVPISTQPPVDPATLSAWRLLRRATWGPKPGEVDRIKQIGATAFLNEQFNAPVSVYPDPLYDASIEVTQEHFVRLALTGQDQLRQRLAWALHKIWVVSGVEVTRSDAIVVYHRILLNGAFGNYRQLMSDITYNPGMGRYLNMLNNRSRAITGAEPNENYARELLQLFTTGIPTLTPGGVPVTNAQGQQVPVYTEDDVHNLARIFTGYTYGDGNPATVPTNLAPSNWRVPMEPVERFHDTTAKTFLGQTFPAGGTARAEVERALDIIFAHPNLPIFISRQLIQMLVRSNPSTQYVSDVAATFANNGSGVRGDLRAVVTRILTHPEANVTSATGDKLMEPALFVSSIVRTLNANVADHPFMTDLSEEMGQRIMYPPSVFSYFSPGYRIRGTTVNAPEFQGLTSVTSLMRNNFVARLLGNQFGADVVIDYTPFTSRAADPAGLADYISTLFLGGQMSAEHRAEIINRVQVSSPTNLTERVRTALYLVLASAQYQVDK